MQLPEDRPSLQLPQQAADQPPVVAQAYGGAGQAQPSQSSKPLQGGKKNKEKASR